MVLKDTGLFLDRAKTTVFLLNEVSNFLISNNVF